MLVLLCSSCDPGVSYRRVLQNDSSYDLVVTPLDSNRSLWGLEFGDSLTIPVGEAANLIESNGLGVVSDYEDCYPRIDSIQVQIASAPSLGLNFEINDNTLWNYIVISEDKYGGGECECRMVILDEHIE